MELVPHIKIWLSTAAGQNVIGGGRYRLLQVIDERGSLSAAAEHLGISYRKAWGDLKKAEKSIGKKLVIKNRGGSGGGTTVLTPEGINLLKAYQAFRSDVEQFAQDSYDRCIRKLLKGGGDD